MSTADKPEKVGYIECDNCGHNSPFLGFETTEFTKVYALESGRFEIVYVRYEGFCGDCGERMEGAIEKNK